LYWLIRMGRREQDGLDPMAAEFEAELPPEMSSGRALLLLGIGLLVLLFSSRMVVWGAVEIAHALGISDLVIGLTIVAIGTSLPELAASVMSALRGEHDIAIGNVIGSNIFNILGVLGISGIILPYHLDQEVLGRDFPIMTGFAIALFAMAYGFRKPGSLGRIGGALLLAGYVGYLMVLGAASLQ
ncbi:MAG TPA: calcium/sodium antiporter, partial [Gammaproteobacteria bacterium]|nr:calcium/sodium antiporter [Gammaproteobacteria bacterium]